MTVHIVIDGYNLIRQSPVFSELDRQDLQLGRENLLKNLAAYKRIKGHRMTVVFDGQNAPPMSQKRDRIGGIQVLFSRKGETADAVIKRIADREREKAIVVSSDREVADFAQSRGAAVLSSPAFESKVEMATELDSSFMKEGLPESEGWIPTTRKKGPRRRLPKRKRRNLNKTKVL